ncbi:trace amine-associated receptor 7e-like [Periophthalmus magnuspinnatus]|uniref:G-protein coupled receptors family 1 profile domain-containing protein n=1 Tax=Periophthalmus magnuspinnatus TaxID=409849 RepID=A0A3B4A8C7_9GOBI|nr:trace amine-associated receptor 7e-like [Periophthalmus magnuspinnatus]
METEEAELCFPHLHNSSCRKPLKHTSETYITLMLYTLMTIAIILLNLLVIVSIAHFRQLHSASNFILLSLAVSDFLVGLVVSPFVNYIMIACWYFGEILCAFFYVVTCIVLCASVGTIVLISIDRYIAISDPLRYSTKMNSKTVNISISICWMNALLYSVFVMFENWLNLGAYKSCHGECVISFLKEVDLIWAFVLPIAIIIILYFQVFLVVVSQSRAMRSHVAAVNYKNTKKSETKAAKNLGLVVLVYVLCYCPYYCVAYSDTLAIASPVQTFIFFLLFINSALNPLIYTMIYPWFRKSIKLIVTLQILRSGSRDFLIL